MIRKKAKGFTLLEIMVAVAVLGILAVIVIPNYIKSREVATRNTCRSNLAEIENAKALWLFNTDAGAGSEPTPEDLAPYLKGGFPSGPTENCNYIIGNSDTMATCAFHGGVED